MNFRSFRFRGGHNFLGLHAEENTYNDAKAVILPVPYDSTTSYRSGTREGPTAIIQASKNIELFDIALGCEPLNTGVFTMPEVEPDMAGPEATVKGVEEIVDQIVQDGKLPVVLGGEHSISTAPAAAMAKRFPDSFSVLQIDAHADLRESYENTPYNHASVMSRIIKFAPVTQVGIRNISGSEMEFVRSSGHKGIFWAHEIKPSNSSWMYRVVEQLQPNVFVTIDLDGLDPSIMPAVGTPEPGGLLWDQVTDLMEKVIAKRNVVGFDVMELCPIPGNIAPDFLAAKLVFRILAEIFNKNGWIV